MTSLDTIKRKIKEMDLSPKYVWTGVAGIKRGGIIPAMLIGEKYNLDVILIEPGEMPPDGSLVVDDICDTGATVKPYLDAGFQVFCICSKNDMVEYIDLIEGDEWIEFPWETENDTAGGIEQAVTSILRATGENPLREGLLNTPKRVTKAWHELTAGYKADLDKLFTVFEAESYDQMVLLKDIEFYSTCEHHMLPFFGKAHIAYIPDGKIVGISKLARVVDVFAKRFQNQERITEQVVQAIEKHLKP